MLGSSMNISDLSHFIDLGGVFILAMLLINAWNSRFEKIEEKLTRLIALVVLSLKGKITDDQVINALSQKELEVVEKLK
jgi:hypothetical protein